MINFTDILDKMTALVTDSKKILDTTELFKYEKLLSGEQTAEEVFEQVSSRKNGTAKKVYLSSTNTYRIFMDIYIYSEDSTIDLVFFAEKLRNSIKVYWPSGEYVVSSVDNRTAFLDFSFIKVIALNNIDEALEMAQQNGFYSNFIYIYDEVLPPITISSPYGGNSGIMWYGSEAARLAHEIGHLLGYYNRNAYDSEENFQLSGGWSHSCNLKSLFSSKGTQILHEQPDFDISKLNLGEFATTIGFIGMPRANAIYNESSFGPIQDGVKFVPTPIFYDDKNVKEFESVYGFDFFADKTNIPFISRK
ncbi:MAG: hypothetical protein JXL97_13800 [Bacteroidales bacterium]|nr:hypothetical protein [Bacteroidales bacterium]